MNIISAYISGQIQSGFDNDIFTATEKNISNWTSTGSTTASVSYNNETKIDTITFSSSSTPATTAQQFVEGFAKFGITCSLATAQEIVTSHSGQSGWTGYPSKPWSIAFMVGKKSDSNVINIMPYYTGLGTIKFTTTSGYTTAYYGNSSSSNYLSPYSQYNYNIGTNTIGSFRSTISGGNALENVSIKGVLEIYTTVDRDYTLSFDIPNFEVGQDKKYLLEINQLTSTSYTKDSSIHDITLTNDSDSYTLDFDNTISSEYNRYRVSFVPTVVACSLKLSLKGMKGENVDLKIKDISLFELQ